LETLLPDVFNGEPLKKQSFDGTALGSDIASREMEGFLTAHGKKLTDFGEAGASDPRNAATITFLVFHLQGVAAADLQVAIVASTQAVSPNLQLTTVTVAGKTVLKGVDGHGIRYIYSKNGLVYGVQAATQASADQALAMLP
jgi:hypothetical protein